MPVYVVYTEETTQHVYEIKVDLPIDMGESTERLTDRMVREAIANGTINSMLDNFNVDSEAITEVTRDGKTIHPGHRRKAKKSPVDEALDLLNKQTSILDTVPVDEED